jgi:hypothetical protein
MQKTGSFNTPWIRYYSSSNDRCNHIDDLTIIYCHDVAGLHRDEELFPSFWSTD